MTTDRTASHPGRATPELTATSGGAHPTTDPVAPLAARVAAAGADVRRLTAVLAWLTTPGRSADALRRACLDPQLPLTSGDLGADPTAGDRVFATVLAAQADGTARGSVGPALQAWQAAAARVATVLDPGYPARLATSWPFRDVPPLLAWRGSAHPARPAVAIVGARRATGYGTAIAAWLAGAVAASGVRVVSGGALGIDAAAHRAALGHPGGTTVVLGCGHAVAYPRDHARPGGLFDQIRDDGGTLLSEQLPHVRPHAGNVRARNRIVAALADAVVVVEGGDRSGALITATAAAEHDVPVLAVPGDVRAPGSAAPHRLLAEGAAPCTSPADLLAALPGAAPPPPEAPSTTGGGPSVLPPDVHRELAAMWPRPCPVDDLASRSGRPAAVLLGLLTRARVAGEIAEDAGGVRLRRAPR